MYWNVIDDNRYKLLEKVVKNIRIDDYYMAGGTALAIQMGIRKSVDFDFFIRKKFDVEYIIEQLNSLGRLEIISYREGTLHCMIDNVQFTFLYFPNELIDSLVEVKEIKNLYLANIRDIATMKLIAISQRGTKKDFFDLYNICIKFNYSIKDILELLKIKYNENKINYSHIIQSISYFEDAEDNILPEVFVKYDWNDIKKFYIEEQKKLYNI